ncbi:MAG TPA: matrixin family metalloprotease, partial [Abditibacteriaceae bacterium]
MITPRQWQILNVGQRGLLRSMLLDVREGRATFEPCFAPGTEPEVIHTFDSAASSLNAYRVGGRWTQTVTNSSLSRGDAMTLTWSIVPDTTAFSSGSGSGNSNLVAWATTTYGSLENFKVFVRQMFSRYTDLTGIRYVEMTADDGQPLPNVAGAAGVRGDIRIAGRNIDGNSNTLAYNYFPNSGDMVIDTNDTFYAGDRDSAFFPTRGLFNVLAHEHGHGLGLDHVCPTNGTKLMEPFISKAYEGLQRDDIQGSQRNHGDTLEYPSGNDSINAATDLGTLSIGTASRSNLSIDGSNDVDVFRFGRDAANRGVTVTVAPLGASYDEGPQSGSSCTTWTSFDPRSQSNLIVQLLDGNGNLMAQADNGVAGATETISLTGLSNSTSHYVRVLNSGGDVLQGYEVEITLSARTNAAPDVDVALSPLAPNRTDTLTAAITASDPEGNAFSQSIRWLRNGVIISGQTTTTLNLNNVSGVEPGDIVTVEVTADDGNGALGRGAGTVTVQELAGLTVTILTDTVADDGQTSLREAYNYALTLSASPTPEISFGSLTGTVSLSSALPDLSRAVKITGPGLSTLALTGNTATRLVKIVSGGALELSGLTVKEFKPPFSDLSGYGGVFYITDGSLTVSNCEFRNNVAPNFGGVVYVPSDATAGVTLSFSDCTFKNNSAFGAGAIWMQGLASSLTMTRCTLDTN